MEHQLVSRPRPSSRLAARPEQACCVAAVLTALAIGVAAAPALLAGESIQAPTQLLVAARPGRHTAGVDVDANYSYYQPGDVLVYPVSVIVTGLPPAKTHPPVAGLFEYGSLAERSSESEARERARSVSIASARCTGAML